MAYRFRLAAVAARFGCILFRLFSFCFSFSCRFLFVFILCLWWAAKKFYYCNGKSAMKMRSAILLSFSLHFCILSFCSSQNFPWVGSHCFSFLFFCILIKTRSNKIPAVFTWLENDFPWRRAWKIVGTTNTFFLGSSSHEKCEKQKKSNKKNSRWTYEKWLFLLAARGRLKRYCTACNCQHVVAKRGRVCWKNLCNSEWSCNFYGRSINFHYFNACFMRAAFHAETQKLKNCSSSGSTIFAQWPPMVPLGPVSSLPSSCHTMLNPQIYDACGQFGTYGNCPSTLWGYSARCARLGPHSGALCYKLLLLK